MKKESLLVVLRLFMGWIFLWSFFDKLLGLGFGTISENSWLMGVSPTMGFLSNGVKGPFAEIFRAISGNLILDWLFMIGLLLIGISLILGVARKISCYTGALMMSLIWLSVLPPANNPVIDDHIIYIIVLLLLSKTKTNCCLEKWWLKLKIVKRFPFLK